jgi:hypothetical protein
MNTASWLSATGFEASTLRLTVAGVLVAFLLFALASVVLTLFDAAAHRQLAPGIALRYVLRGVVAVVLFSVIFWR